MRKVPVPDDGMLQVGYFGGGETHIVLLQAQQKPGAST